MINAKTNKIIDEIIQELEKAKQSENSIDVLLKLMKIIQMIKFLSDEVTNAW